MSWVVSYWSPRTLVTLFPLFVCMFANIHQLRLLQVSTQVETSQESQTGIWLHINQHQFKKKHICKCFSKKSYKIIKWRVSAAIPSKAEADKGFHTWLINNSEVNCLPVKLKSNRGQELIKVPKLRNVKAWSVYRNVVFSVWPQTEKVEVENLFKQFFFNFFINSNISKSSINSATMLLSNGNKMFSQLIKKIMFNKHAGVCLCVCSSYFAAFTCCHEVSWSKLTMWSLSL